MGCNQTSQSNHDESRKDEESINDKESRKDEESNKDEEPDKDVYVELHKDEEVSESNHSTEESIQINYRNVEDAIYLICLELSEGMSINAINKEILDKYTENEIKLAIKCINIRKYQNTNYTTTISDDYKIKHNFNNIDSSKLKYAQVIIKNELFKEQSFDSIKNTLSNELSNTWINLALSTIKLETYSKYDEIPPIVNETLVYGYIRIQYDKNVSTDIIRLIFKYSKKIYVMYGVGDYYNIGLGRTPEKDFGDGSLRTVNIGIKYAQKLAPELIKSVAAVYYGWCNFLCISTDDRCYAVGRNCFGQLGSDPKSNLGFDIEQISNWSECNYFKANNIKIKLISANNIDNTCMFYVDFDNNIYGCGDNRQGELGIGKTSEECIFTPVVINEYNEAFKDRNSFEVRQIVIGGGGSMILMENGDIYVTGLNWERFTDNAMVTKFKKFDYFGKQSIKIVKIALPSRFDNDTYFLAENGTLYVFTSRAMNEDDVYQTTKYVIQPDLIFFQSPYPLNNDVEFYGAAICGEVKLIYECKFFSNNGIKIRDIEAGKEHMIVLDQYFKVWTFGANSSWQCGVETDEEALLIPACISEEYDLLPIKRIKGAGYSTILVTFTDNLYVFGWNNYNCLFTREHEHECGCIEQPFYLKNTDILPNHARIVDVVCNSDTGSTILVAEC